MPPALFCRGRNDLCSITAEALIRFSVEDRAVVRALKWYRGNTKRVFIQIIAWHINFYIGRLLLYSIGSCTAGSFKSGSCIGHRVGVWCSVLHLSALVCLNKSCSFLLIACISKRIGCKPQCMLYEVYFYSNDPKAWEGSQTRAEWFKLSTTDGLMHGSNGHRSQDSSALRGRGRKTPHSDQSCFSTTIFKNTKYTKGFGKRILLDASFSLLWIII